MKDTIRFLSTDPPPEGLADRLENPLDIVDRKTGAINVQGYLRNLRISAGTHRVVIEGSLIKYTTGHNVETFDCHDDFVAALDELASDTGIDLPNARVTRLDLATTLRTDHAVPTYIHAVGQNSRYKRQPYPRGVQLVNSRRTISLYDKAAEAGSSLPEEYEGMNLLRVEVQFGGTEIRKQLGKPPVLRSLLKAEVAYRFLDQYLEALKPIEFYPVPLSPPATAQELRDTLSASMYHAFGPRSFIEPLQHAADAGVIERHQFRRRKKEMLQLAGGKSPELVDVSKEIVEKLEERVASYRKGC